MGWAAFHFSSLKSEWDCRKLQKFNLITMNDFHQIFSDHSNTLILLLVLTLQAMLQVLTKWDARGSIRLGMTNINSPTELISIRGNQEILGCSRGTIYNLLSAGRLSAVKLGARTLVPKSALNRFIENLEKNAPYTPRSSNGWERKRGLFISPGKRVFEICYEQA